MRVRPEYIDPKSAKFLPAVVDVVGRYDFDLDKSRCLLDRIGRYASICVIMTQKKDRDDTREVYLERHKAEDGQGWVWYALDIHMPYYAEHKAAVYAEACRIALELDGQRWQVEQGTSISRLAHDRLLTVHTLDRCPSCQVGYLIQQQIFDELEGLSWISICQLCLVRQDINTRL